jgi:hypothetical protein
LIRVGRKRGSVYSGGIGYFVGVQLVIGEKEGAPAEERLDTGNDLVQISLGQGPGDTGRSRQVDELRREKDTAKQDWNLGAKRADLTGHLDPVLAGHHEIQDDDIRSKFPGLANGIFSVAGFATDFPSRVAAEKSPETLANDRAVICD